LQDVGHRQAAFLTFVVTASGFSLWGISSAFWGLVAGLLAWGLAYQRQA
jgi:benzoate membrane transport protein